MKRSLLLAAVVTALLGGSVNANTQPAIPVLDCTVTCADGWFDAYSGPPAPGDKAVLDLSKYEHGTNTHDILQFTTVRKNVGPDYVIIQTPLKLVKANLDTNHLLSWRYESDIRQVMHSQSRMDIRKQSGDSWKIYYTYDVEGVTVGVVLMTATAHK